MIDSVNDLMKLTEDELTEKLLDDKYNKANLRELVRSSFKKIYEYKTAFEYEQKLNRDMTSELIDVKMQLSNCKFDLSNARYR